MKKNGNENEVFTRMTTRRHVRKTRKCRAKTFCMCVNRLYCFCISTVGCRNEANLFSRIRARRAGRVNDPTIERDEATVGRGETCGPTVGFRKEVNHSQLCHVLGATTQVSPLERGQPIAAGQDSRAFIL